MVKRKIRFGEIIESALRWGKEYSYADIRSWITIQKLPKRKYGYLLQKPVCGCECEYDLEREILALEFIGIKGLDYDYVRVPRNEMFFDEKTTKTDGRYVRGKYLYITVKGILMR